MPVTLQLLTAVRDFAGFGKDTGESDTWKGVEGGVLGLERKEVKRLAEKVQVRRLLFR